MTGRRWHSWSAASPLWAPGLILIVLGVALVAAAVRTVHRGPR